MSVISISSVFKFNVSLLFLVLNHLQKWPDVICFCLSKMFEIYGIIEDDFGNAYESWTAGFHPDDADRGNEEIQKDYKRRGGKQ